MSRKRILWAGAALLAGLLVIGIPWLVREWKERFSSPGGSRWNDKISSVGEKMLRSEKYSRAMKIYNQMMENDPNDARAYSGRGRVYYDIGSMDRALREFNKALEMTPEDPLCHVSVGDVYRVNKEYDKALKKYKEAVDLDPDCFAGLYHVSLTHILKKEFDPALEYANRALKCRPQEPVGYLNRAFIYYKKDKFDKSFQDYKKALELDPTYDVALIGMARCMQQTGKIAQAIGYYEKAEALAEKVKSKNRLRENSDSDTGPKVIVLELADSYFLAGEFQKAMDECDRAEKTGTRDPMIHEIRGLILYFTGNSNEAREQFNKFLKSELPSPLEEADDYDAYGWAYLALGDKKKAEYFFRRSIEMDPEYYSSHMGIGKLFYDRGEYVRAETQLLTAKNLEPKAPGQKEITVKLLEAIEKQRGLAVNKGGI